jgi:hypothetical protein
MPRQWQRAARVKGAIPLLCVSKRSLAFLPFVPQKRHQKGQLYKRYLPAVFAIAGTAGISKKRA